MKKFSHRFRVNAALAEVAVFHRNPRALKILTPLPLWVQYREVEPLAENSRARFTIWAGPIPLRWEALHTQVSNQGFTDTQVSGPYKYWVHQHHFTQIHPSTTEIEDEISAIYGESFFWNLTTRLMWLGMPILFAYRSWKTRRVLEGHK